MDMPTSALLIPFSLLIIQAYCQAPTATEGISMAEIITDCCGRGISFASMGQNCSGMAGLPDVAMENREKCEAVFMSCCHHQTTSADCNKGILHRLGEGDCELFPQQDSCSYSAGKECCDCCGLGIQAYHMGMACNGMRIDTPCDHAFETCCQKTRQEFDVTSTQPMNPCLNNPCSQSCQIVDSHYECICTLGYRLALNGITCIDIDECAELAEACAEGQECRNSEGEYFCSEVLLPTCSSTGLRYDVSTGRCGDINECIEDRNICDVGEECLNTLGSYSCQLRRISQQRCPRGLRYYPSTGACSDINECLEGNDNCPASTTCFNVYKGYQCRTQRRCRSGFQVDPVTGNCIDINECYQNANVCTVGQRCENTEGSYRCVRRIACGTGYNLNSDSQDCEDINECEQNLHRCQRHQRCINEIGSHLCENCLPGYRVNIRNECNIDIDECAESLDTCTSTQNCYNTQGEFTCTCIPGYNYDDNLRDCVDVDECNPEDGVSPCLPNQMCINFPGEYDCHNMCSYGARYIHGTCVDINECEDGTHQCKEMQECINQEGGHICRCPLGYRLTRSSSRGCEDIDECTVLPNSCRGSCENTDGSYRCLCPDGYTLNANGFSCNDNNECTLGTHSCQQRDQECFNTLGGFKCRSIECPDYYERRLAGNQRECVKDFDLCPEGDTGNSCRRDMIVKYTYTAFALPSMPYISSPIRLLTIDINKSSLSQVTFRLIAGNERGYFTIQRRAIHSSKVRASLLLIRAINGPYSTDLHLEVSTTVSNRVTSKNVIIIYIDIGANIW